MFGLKGKYGQSCGKHSKTYAMAERLEGSIDQKLVLTALDEDYLLA